MARAFGLAISALVAGLVAACGGGGSDPPPASDDTGDDGASGDGTAAADDGDGGDDDPSTSDAPGDDGDDTAGDESTGEPPPVLIDCTPVCGDLASDAGKAVCYACRCKNAMDGWLPSEEEMQCSQAEEIVIYHADVSGPAPELVPATESANECANPSLLTTSCAVGSKLGQIEHGDVLVKWICRDPIGSGESLIYDDVGAIAYNLRTGASCWWDDINVVTGEDDLPAVDLMEYDEANLARHLEVFYYTEGDGCTPCHDNDPFIYTPYLQSREWPMGPHSLSRYSHVRIDGSLEATANSYLVTKEVVPCATCHRISSAGTCDFLAADSMAIGKEGFTYEAAVLDAAEPGSPHWSLAYWMPNGPNPVESYAEWMKMFGATKDHIVECCMAPGVNTASCEWEPIPG